MTKREIIIDGSFGEGGGEIALAIKPTQEKHGLDLQERGAKTDARIVAVLANLKCDIDKREIKAITKRFLDVDIQTEQLDRKLWRVRVSL